MKNQSQSLGQRGEAAIQNACANTGLHWSKPLPDETAIDAIIQWPVDDHDRHYNLDSRPATRRCHVQVKATEGAKSRSVRLTLRAAEQLAKVEIPAFVIVPIFDGGEHAVRYAAFHIRGAHLERILKRLREAERDGKKTNKLTLTFSLSNADAAGGSAEELRQYLESQVGDDFNAYMDEKRRELELAGFEPDRGATLEVVFEIEDESEIIDMLLGKRRLPLEIKSVKDRRFDIELESRSFPMRPGHAELSVEPSTDLCANIAAFDENGRDIVKICATENTAALPDLSEEFWKKVISNGIVSVEIKGHHISIDIDRAALINESHDIGVLTDTVVLWHEIAHNKAGLAVDIAGDKRIFSRSLNFDEDDDIKHWLDLIRVLAAARDVFGFCSAADISVTPRRLQASARSIQTAAQLISTQDKFKYLQALNITIDSGERRNKIVSENQTNLFFNALRISGYALAFATECVCDTKEVAGGVKVVQKTRRPIAGIMLGDDDAEGRYQQFQRDMIARLHPDWHFALPLAEEEDVEIVPRERSDANLAIASP